MPELPEVETTCRSLSNHLAGRTITKVLVHQPKLRWPVPRTIIATAKGAIIQSITRRAKYLLLVTSRGTAIIHLGMSGKFYMASNEMQRKKHDHIEVWLDNDMIVRYNDPRRFGAFLWTESDPLDHPMLSNLGIEPLERTFNAQYIFKQSRKKKVVIKQFLMDSKIVVGVGNIYSNEALFKARIHPKRIVCTLTLEECKMLAQAIKSVLKAAIKSGGTTLKDFLSPEGNLGYFVQKLAVYGRQGEQCFECQRILKMTRIGQRSTVYCSNCQN